MTRKNFVRFDPSRSRHQWFGDKVVFGIICSSTLLARQRGKEIGNVELARRSIQPVPMDLSAMGSQDQQFQGNCSWCGVHGRMARDCRRKTEYMQNIPTSGWSGTDDKTRGKPGEGKGKQDKGKGNGKPDKGKHKSKSKGKAKQHGKKGKKCLHDMVEARRQTRNTNRSRIHRVDGHELGSR